MIFYGDEAGMWGSNDPDCRKPMVWAEKTYTSETFNPDQSQHDADVVASNGDLFNLYKKFIGLRNKYEAIRLGNFTSLLADDTNKLYAFSRKYNDEEVIVIVNRGSKPATFSNTLVKTGKFKDVFSGTMAKKVTVNAMDIIVLSNRL